MPCAISSRTTVSTEPEARALDTENPYEFTATGAGDVDFKRMNSVSKPTRNSTPDFDFASLRNMHQGKRKSGRRGNCTHSTTRRSIVRGHMSISNFGFPLNGYFS